jgi:hypothetical protein
LNWKILLVGFVLLGLSAFAQAAYNPYANFSYARPAYSQFYAYPGVFRAAEIYYPTYTVYSPYYYYRSPAATIVPATVTVYSPPIVPVAAVYPVRSVVYNEPVGLVSTVTNYGTRIGASFTVMFAG